MSISSRVCRARDEVAPTLFPAPAGPVQRSDELPVAPGNADATRDGAVLGGRSRTHAALGLMPPVPAGEYGSVEVRRALRRDRSERRARYRRRWWFPLLILGLVVTGFWGALKVDQRVADKLVWPSHGARFAEVSSSIATSSRPGGRLMIVVGGLNRTSGTGVAMALLPSLEDDGSRVFSLVYGSGINDQDIRDKFDALVADVKPREVSFFGSSMGGDVVLNMAAHAQQNRDQYVQDVLVSGPATPDLGQPTADGSVARGVAHSDPAGDRPLGSETGAVGEFLVPAAMTGVAPALAGHLPVATVDAASATENSGTPDSGTPDHRTQAGGASDGGDQAPAALPPPRIGTIFLDCTPLGTDDVRDASRAQADALTGLTEAIGTDGGAVTRLAAELLGQRHQWASGRFPFLQVRWDAFDYKFDQVMREKIGGSGVSTQLIKDQYGVIRRLDMDTIAQTLAPGSRIVYFLPATPTDDHTVRVERVQTELQALESSASLDVEFVPIPDGHHAGAESNADSYRLAIDAARDVGR